MRLSFITDEATQSLPEAAAFAKANGLDGVELRSVDDTPVDMAGRDTLLSWRELLDENGLAVSNLASSFFKCSESQAEVSDNLRKLERLCDAADILGCGTIRGFAFFAPPEGPRVTECVLSLFDAPLRLLEARGKRLLLEADPSVNTTNHRALADLIAALDNPTVGAIYDPGNDIYDPLGEAPYPDGYEAVRPYLAHVHIKDALRGPDGQPECVRVGSGWVDYLALLRALLSDGYTGWLSLETHYRINAALTEEQMRLPQGSAFSQGGLAATEESAAALRALLRQAEKEVFG